MKNMSLMGVYLNKTQIREINQVSELIHKWLWQMIRFIISDNNPSNLDLLLNTDPSSQVVNKLRI